MAKKSVVVSTCDQCSKEVTNDFKPTIGRAEFELPDGWLHVRADDRHKQIFALDFCDDCSKPIRNLAGKANAVRKTNNKKEKSE